MNKSFKMLLTLFFGILFFISSFAANSAESLGEQLIKIEELYERGTITKEEFAKAKTILLKIDTQSSEKIEKAKEKIIKQRKKEEKDKLVAKLTSESNQKKTYNTTEITKYTSNAPNQWERTEFYFDDYRVYAHRPGAIKIRRMSDGKQVAVLTKNFKIKYYNDSDGLFETKTFKENTLEKHSTIEELIPLLGILNKKTREMEKKLNKMLGKKELPGKMTVKYNGARIFNWERIYVPQHRAQFYQLLALNDQPFHFYVVHPKGELALNMAKFTKKIDIAVGEAKKKIAKEYNLTDEEVEKILKKRKDNLDKQLAAISEETGKIIAQETSKAVDSEVDKEVASAVDAELAKELASVIGEEATHEIAQALDEALGAELVSAIEQEFGQSIGSLIDESIADAVAEGISAATAEAALRASIEVLNQGGSIEQAIATCKAAGGGAAC